MRVRFVLPLLAVLLCACATVGSDRAAMNETAYCDPGSALVRFKTGPILPPARKAPEHGTCKS